MLIEAKIVAHHFEEIFNKRRALLRSLLVKFRVVIKRKKFFSLLERKKVYFQDIKTLHDSFYKMKRLKARKQDSEKDNTRA